jgi:hypothetical protein
MKRYYKDGKLVVKPKHLIVRGRTYVNPSDKVLIRLGYEIKEEAPQEPKPTTNTDIEQQRYRAYQHTADPLFIAYKVYSELGEIEKAEEVKTKWLLERERINEQFPYQENIDL